LQDGSLAIHYACSSGLDSIVELLLQNGTRVNCGCVLNSRNVRPTPLMFAVQGGFLKCIKLLLEHGADPLEAVAVR
jgi:ankyrin repeat protein